MKELSIHEKKELALAYKEVVILLKTNIYRREITLCKELAKLKTSMALEYLQENRPTMGLHPEFFIHATYSSHHYIWWRTGELSSKAKADRELSTKRCNVQRVKFLEHLIEQLGHGIKKKHTRRTNYIK